MSEEKLLNIPNALSMYRLLSFPFLLWMVLTGRENLFAIFLCINLVTDILDGLIARGFNLQTKFGARLDSLADNGTYILAFLGIVYFKMEVLKDVMWMLYLFLFLFILGNVTSLLKFRKFPSLHLYSTKIAGYAQGIFFFSLFAIGYYPLLFYLAMILGYLSWLEEFIILLRLDKMRSNARGLYWLSKEKEL